MKNCIYLITLLFSSFSFTQNLSIQFLEESFDFKEIEEDAGKVSHDFSFINRGIDPIAIVSANADCGCTTPSWTEKTLQSGDTGVVVAEYDPYDFPGKFDKKITVKFTNGEETVLKINGIVLPRIKSKVEEELPEVMGCLLFESNYIQLSKVTDNKAKEKRVKFYNNCDSVITIVPSSLLSPKHIELKFNAIAIDPKSYGAATLIFDPIKKNKLGYSRDDISFKTNEDTLEVKNIIVMAQIGHYFPSMTSEELAKEPIAQFDTLEYNYGTKPTNTKVSFSFPFYNMGEKSLEILEVDAACTCLTAKVSKSKIEKGERGTIDVEFDGKDRTGTQVKTIIVYTNDPAHSIITLKMKGKLN